jgi:hypothetical protein
MLSFLKLLLSFAPWEAGAKNLPRLAPDCNTGGNGGNA